MESRRPSYLLLLFAFLFLLAARVAAAAAVLGIDLGTEYFKAALVKPGIPLEIVLTKDSRRKDVSAIAFKPSQAGSKDGLLPETIYGADAMAIAARFPGNVYPNLKTLLGLPVGSDIVREYAARHPSLHLRAHKSRGTTTFKPEATDADEAGEEAWMVEELLAMELQNIRKNAELTAGGGMSVRSVVLTVPPFYTKEERRAVRTAAELAGLKVLSLISDGLAVGLNYATTRQFPKVSDGAQPEYHLVFDMGAGSTTATVMRFQSRSVRDIGKFNKTVQEVQVIGGGWDRTLGGDALNYLILDDMISQFVESSGAKKISLTAEAVKSNGRAVAKLLKEAERLRQVLSANQNTQANFEGLLEDVDFKYKITRAEFEAMTEKLLGRAIEVIDRAIDMTAIKKDDLTSIILHGGASRTPFVQKALEDFAGSADKLRSNVNADEAAVFGAGFRAADISPSFRVKEIRVQDSPMYETGFTRRRSSAKPQRQRIWAPTSTVGGPVKELTFTDHNDFSLTFFEAVGEEDRDIKSFVTKNLTATVSALLEQHPSCAASGIAFKLGVRLSPEDGEVQVVKAAVTCDVETTEKDSFVGGVKNLFGFGKKEQKPLADGEKNDEVDIAVDAEGKDKETVSSSLTTSASSSAAGPTSSAATAERGSEKDDASMPSKAAASSAAPNAEPKGKQTVSIPVDYALESAGLPVLDEEEWAKAKDKLKAFAASDKARAQREEALNLLEGYTYKVRDLLDGEAFVLRSTEKERKRVAELVSQTSDWLYGAGAEASKEELKSKLGVVQDLVAPIETRIDEAEKRPELIGSLRSVMKMTTQLVGELRKQLSDFETWEASMTASIAGASSSASSPATGATSAEFDDLEDDEKGRKGGNEGVEEPDDVEQEILARRPLYSKEEIDAFDSLIQSTDQWLQEQETRQAALDPAADAVLTFQALEEKLQVLDKAGQKLVAKQKAKTTAKKKNKGKGTKAGSGGGRKKVLFKDGDAAFDASMFGEGADDKLSDEQREYLTRMFEELDAKHAKGGKAQGKQGEADDEAGGVVKEEDAEGEEQKQEKKGGQGVQEKGEEEEAKESKGKADIHDEL